MPGLSDRRADASPSEKPPKVSSAKPQRPRIETDLPQRRTVLGGDVLSLSPESIVPSPAALGPRSAAKALSRANGPRKGSLDSPKEYRMGDLRDDFRQALLRLRRAAAQAQGRPGAEQKLQEIHETWEKLHAHLARIQGAMGPRNTGQAEALPPFHSRFDTELREFRQAVVPLRETIAKVLGQSHLEEARSRIQGAAARPRQPQVRTPSAEEMAMNRLNDLHEQMEAAMGFLAETVEDAGLELGIDEVHAFLAEGVDLDSPPARLDSRDLARIEGALRSLSSEMGEPPHDPDAPHAPEIPSLLGMQERLTSPRERPPMPKRKSSMSAAETLQQAMKKRVDQGVRGSWGAFGSGSSEESALPPSGDTSSNSE
jgi:hypothetical protein